MPSPKQPPCAQQLQLNNDLLRAAELGSWRSIEALVAAGADPLFVRHGATGFPEASVFSIAAWNGRPLIIKKLIGLVEAQCPRDDRALGAYSFAFEAACGFNARIALIFLPLVLALSNNAPAPGLMGRCLNHAASDSDHFGADAKALLFKIIACENISARELGSALLTAAAARGAPQEAIERILEAGRSGPNRIQTISTEALSAALLEFCVASKTSFEAGLALIHEGASTRAPSSSSGHTPLMNAAGIGNLPMVKILLPLSDIEALALAPSGVFHSAESFAELNGNIECAELIRAFSLSQAETVELSGSAELSPSRPELGRMRL